MRQLKIQPSITNREDQSLDKYLREIDKIPLLTSAEEEAELAKQAREWSTEAIDSLVKANLRFVVSVAKQYQNQGLSLSDLINEGNIWLIKAVQKFDETKGFKLISYAVRWIRQSILQALAEQTRIVDIPLNRVWEINKLTKAQQEFEQKFEYEPTPEELAEVLEMTPQEVKKILDNQKSRQHISLDAPFEEWAEKTLLDRLASSEESPDHYITYTKSLQQEIAEAIDLLKKERERKVLKMYYWLDGKLPIWQEVIADLLKIPKEQVEKIKNRAQYNLKRILRNPYLISPKSTKRIQETHISRNKWSFIIEDKKIDHKNIIISLREKYKDWVTIEDIYNNEHDTFWELLNYLYVHDTFLSDDEKSSIMLLYCIISSYKELNYLQNILTPNNGLMQWLYNAIDIVNTIITRDNI